MKKIICLSLLAVCTFTVRIQSPECNRDITCNDYFTILIKAQTHGARFSQSDFRNITVTTFGAWYYDCNIIQSQLITREADE